MPHLCTLNEGHLTIKDTLVSPNGVLIREIPQYIHIHHPPTVFMDEGYLTEKNLAVEHTVDLSHTP